MHRSRGGRAVLLVPLAAVTFAATGAGHGAPAPILRRVRLGRPPLALAAGRGGIWVTNAGAPCGLALRIDGAILAVRARACVDWVPQSVAVANGSVWVVNGPKPEARRPSVLENSLFRLDARTGRIAARIRLANPESATIGGGAVWVDPRVNRVAGTTTLAGPSGAIVTGERAVWVSAKDV